MQSFSFPPARPSAPFRPSSCLPSLLNLPSSAKSACAVSDPDSETKHDDLRLLSPPIQIVLLSNDTTFSSLTRAFLQHAGFAVFTCTTSDRAESLFLSRSDLQLWIIDVQALGMEAVYFANRVREQHPSTPTLLVLGEHGESHSLRQFLLFGWTQLTKPVDLAKMLATINDAIANSPRSGKMKPFQSEQPDAQAPFESDRLHDFRRKDLSRMRN